MAIRPLITLTFYVLHDPKKVVGDRDKSFHFFSHKSHALDAWSEGGLRYKTSANIEKIRFESKAELANFVNNLI